MQMLTFHLRRWQAIGAFLFLAASFVVAVVLITEDVHANHRTILELQRNKASISALQESNCKLRAFLLSSAGFRRRQAAADRTRAQRRKDLKAARVSARLADSLANELCPR